MANSLSNSGNWGRLPFCVTLGAILRCRERDPALKGAGGGEGRYLPVLLQARNRLDAFVDTTLTKL